uniref:NACHT domain-containing protein n=1 Tax=Erpetoichthys calabaricus TaxID=27687 RepID=A0A8C4SUA6_ERPCA
MSLVSCPSTPLLILSPYFFLFWLSDLHETHRVTISESTRPLDDQRPSGDPLTSVVGLETQYTELLVIKQDIKDKLAKDGKTQERLEEEGATKNCERIWTEHLFKRKPKSKTPSKIIVVSGVAGIGKTTMVLNIMSDWARGTQYQRFAFVFLFKFRELSLLYNETQMSLTALIERHYKHFTHDKLMEILQKPESLLFILDGLEEYKHKLDFTDTQLCSKPDDEVPVHILVTSLVSQTLLKGCSVLITSRPTALGSLDMERVDGFVEVVGFFPEQRLMYFKKFFGDADVGTKGFQCMEGNTILYSMCVSPSNCWIICSALKNHFMTPEEERGAAPRTVTEIFVMFLHNILTNHRRETDDQRSILISLGKMAYYGVDNRIHMFNEKQKMSAFGLQPVLSSSFLSGFLHRQRGVEELLKKRDSCKDGRFEAVTRFLAGLAWCPVLKRVEGILGEFEVKTIQQIQEWMKQKAKQVLRGGDKSEALRVCHWLYETQNEEVIRDAIGKDLEVNFSSMTLSGNSTSVHNKMEEEEEEEEEVEEEGCFTDLEVEPKLHMNALVLCVLLSVCLSSLVSLLLHRLWSCGLTSACCSALSSVLSSPNSQLTELDLSNNNLGDSGGRQLIEGLRSDNCKLWRRHCVLLSVCLSSLVSLLLHRLSECGLTSACCSALSSVLSSPNSQLTELVLDNNKLGDSGARQLSEGLRSDNCKLETLW